MPKSKHLSDFELYVMLAVAACAPEAYGVTISEMIESRTRRNVSIGAVYATLGRLADKGFVSFSYSDPDPTPGGRAKKLVALTVPGRRVIRETADALDRMLSDARLAPILGGRR